MGGSTEGTGAGSCLFVPVISSSSGTHSKERRRWLPTSALTLKFALAPKKPSEPNPPPVTKTQSNPRKKTASKEPSIREEDDSDDSGRDEICREHLTKTRLSAGQGPRWESSGTIRGIKLDQASTFCHSGFCIRPVARTARVPDLDAGAVLAYRRPRGHTMCTVSPLKPVTIRSLARSSVQRSRHDAINLFFSSRYARLLLKLLLERDTSTACQRSKAVSLCVGSPGSISRSKRDLLSVCLFNAGQGASPGAAPAVVGGGEACERIKLGCRLQRLSGSSDRSLGEFQPFLWRSPHCLEDGEPSITEPNVLAR